MRHNTMLKFCMKLPCTRRGRRVIKGACLLIAILLVLSLLFQNNSSLDRLDDRLTLERSQSNSEVIEEYELKQKTNKLIQQHRNAKNIHDEYRGQKEDVASETDNSQLNTDTRIKKLRYCDSVLRPKTNCTVGKPTSDKTVKVSFEEHSFEHLNNLHGNDLLPGGHFRPASCQPDQKTAILIPYRDRKSHLKMLLNNLHPFLKKQNVEYTIIVVEQLPGSNFNRGMIKNIGFVEAMKLCNYSCIFFHDIDMVPDDYGNLYRCGSSPMQHSRDLARWKHKKPYLGSFGGVVSFQSAQFQMVNGYTNTYFEWGLEDDEMGSRIRYHKMRIGVKPFNLGSYQEFNHTKSKQYRRSWKWVKKWKSRVKLDGLNSLVYKLEKIEVNPLYTHLFVNISLEAVQKAYNGSIMIAGSTDETMP